MVESKAGADRSMANSTTTSFSSKPQWLLQALNDIALKNGVSIEDEAAHGALVEEFAVELKKHQNNPIRKYGRKTEMMFGYVAAALGECRIVKHEDSGNMYATGASVQSPDFHVILKSGCRFLVEVKNHSRGYSHALRCKADYMSRLVNYAQAFGCPLKFAVYWVRMRRWTLVDADHFDRNGNRFILDPAIAMKRNEMAALGDRLIGTVSPLRLRCYVDPNKPHHFTSSGQAFQFTIGRAALFSNETELHNELDQRIAWYLMRFGEWTGFRRSINTKPKDSPPYIDITVFPEESDPAQGFDMIGALSSTISAHYTDAITNNGKLTVLTPSKPPESFAVPIPKEYYGVDLPLWHFTQVPNLANLAHV